jgi:hypothetical protein
MRAAHDRKKYMVEVTLQTEVPYKLWQRIAKDLRLTITDEETPFKIGDSIFKFHAGRIFVEGEYDDRQEEFQVGKFRG